MSGALSKRQQARNERALQDLIKTVPGNNTCADCQARNPGWASWSLGIFLCMRCAALHRKMGTHITKVKSLSMDSWSNDQVENMKRVGNIASNRVYNPQNKRPPIPIDADEADSAMERFIKQKYQDAGNARAPETIRHNTGSTNSDDTPPPLPPKTGSRFGFRSASSIFPMSSKSSKAQRERDATVQFEARQREESQSPPRNKPSRIFGTSVGSEVPDDLEYKIAKLRDMGFRDEKRNLAILKGLGGNMDKTIETLVRLGEGGQGGVVTIGNSGANSGPTPWSRSPLSVGVGLSINRTQDTKSPPRSARSAISGTSSNPFDMLDSVPAQPQSSQSTGAMGAQSQQNLPSTNPFGLQPAQSYHNLNQAFQNMSIQPSQQPLFPNHTGGFPAQQPPQNPMYQQSMTPPVPTIPQQFYSTAIYENSAQQPAPQQPAQQQAQQNYNPFMQQQQQQPTPQALGPINTNFQNNPFMSQQSQSAITPTTQPFFQSPVIQPQQVQQPFQNPFYSNGMQQSPQPLQNQQHNPFFQNNQQAQVQLQSYGYQQSPQQPQPQSQQPQQQVQYDQYRQQTHPMVAQQTGRPDKRSILDLYNYPQLAPTPPQPQQQQEQIQQQASQNFAQNVAAQQQQPKVSSPLATHMSMAGSRNPFGGGGAIPGQNGGDGLGGMGQFGHSNGARHVSQESIGADSGGWMNGNGRHSPDAFAGLSARSLR